MGAPFEWTDRRIAKLRAMWEEKESLSEIGAAIGCCSTLVKNKSRQLGLERRNYVVKRVNPSITPDDAKAARQHFIEEDRRTPGERAMGDPPLERSALMQAQPILARSQPRISLGSMERVPLGRANGLGALTQQLNRVRRERGARA